jgi:hypothetical protein
MITVIGFAVSLSCAKISSIRLDDFYQGLLLDNLEIDFITEPLTDSLHSKVFVNDILCENKNCFIAYISPNVCGSCERHSLDLINILAKEYPGQVVLIIQNSFYKEAIKMVRSFQFDPSIRIYFDTDGKNIDKFSKMSFKFFNMWQFIVDPRNHVICLRALDYNQKLSMENYQLYFDQVNALLTK